MGKIVGTARKIRSSAFWSSRKPEGCALALFLVSYCVITVFHEPWFDEAQAWQIGKCASLFDILFEIPHYEGHPAFWSLLLAVPARLGVPFELGLKLTGLVISTANVLILLYRTRLPRAARLALPFTYFIFYQYGIIVRPYGLMLLAFLLLSAAFPARHARPWPFIGCLMLLCLTTAFGIVMAGGIALCYLWEITREKGPKGLLTTLFRDRRTLALAALLLLAVLLILEILPREDTYISSANTENSFLQCLFIILFTFHGECTLTSGSWFFTDGALLQGVVTNAPELAALAVIGVLLWIVLVCVSSKRLLKYLLVPYLLTAFFSAGVYFSVHHIGVYYGLLLFWFAILFQDENRFEIGRGLLPVIAKTGRDKRLLRSAVLILGLACLLVPVWWSVGASAHDIQYEYSPGRGMAMWLKATPHNRSARIA